MIFKRFFHKYPGGSKIKCYIEKRKKKKLNISLFHQPLYSKNSKNFIDWRYSTPKSGYEYMYIYGENTIEITNLPNNKTNEYIQERLRKSLNKYGRLKIIRCLSHRNDPYINNNICYATFYNRKDMYKCIRNINIRLPISLQYKILKFKSLLSNKCNDYNYFFKQDHYNYSAINIALNLFKYLEYNNCSMNIKDIYKHVFEYSFYPHKIISSGISVYKIFKNWTNFIYFFDNLFHIVKKDDDIFITAKILNDQNLSIYLNNKLIELKKKTEQSNSVYWREHSLQLPEEIENRINNDRPKKLKEELQLLSKTKDFYKIHDERHLFKLKLNKERKEKKKMLKKNKQQEKEEKEKEKQLKKEMY
ncbi:hypothetical protein PGSY75_1135500 [Plasmodium gaboni]|uniref:RRM domain-containing protein n=1 Tax=Plasmodium gaboni TaxID=647221 RepID=A0A151LJA7_9APIC|nr:hypothetical protein PGSY75_1135500 [Plasmodium gaboni]KYN98992.1 hypothetical protein PGSY75_1135500 [Plasmodium gaboni]SOV23431.1 conserved Plasmodium protein, unknown function [Plasmodium sp. DRC-Itaito]